MMISKKLVASLAIASLSLIATTSAHAEVVVVVSSKNTAATLTQDQVSDIFLGKTNNLPGAGGRAVPINRGEGSPVREIFYNKGLGKTPAQLSAHWSRQLFTGKAMPLKSVDDIAELKVLFATNPNVISYIDKSAVDDSFKVLFTIE